MNSNFMDRWLIFRIYLNTISRGHFRDHFSNYWSKKNRFGEFGSYLPSGHLFRNRGRSKSKFTRKYVEGKFFTSSFSLILKSKYSKTINLPSNIINQIFVFRWQVRVCISCVNAMVSPEAVPTKPAGKSPHPSMSKFDPDHVIIVFDHVTVQPYDVGS